MGLLDGRVAIITGASAGLGRAAAYAFAREGARVVITARREERLREVCDAIAGAGGECAYHAGDAGAEETARSVVALAMYRFGRVDILINNAGLGRYKLLTEMTAGDYDDLMWANVRSGFVFAKEVAPGMVAQAGGSIVFVSSVAGLQGAAKECVYSATKFAQVGMAQSLDAELRPHGIKVCAFCPGGMKTEFAVGHGRTEESVAASRYMTAEEVAESLLHVCALPANVRVPQVVVRHMG